MKNKKDFWDIIKWIVFFLIMILIIICSIIILIYQFSHPQLTQTQIYIWTLKKFWWMGILVFGYFMLHYWK